MPERYHIHPTIAPPRFRPVGKLGIVDWREDCAGCHNCVKRTCVYDLYRDEAAYLRADHTFLDYLYQCKGCMNCVQNCTKNLLTRIVNPDYARLGDEYYTPEVVLTTWAQAETGRIPVSGAGYRGPFSGHGFDAMWTDMSEIVRPTRDGIHGREYISTMVDIGRKLPFLRFDNGGLAASAPPLIESPLPVMFDRLPLPWANERLYAALVSAAARMGLWAVVPEELLSTQRSALSTQHSTVVPLLQDGSDRLDEALIGAARMVEIKDSERVFERVAKIKSLNRDVIVVIRVEAAPATAARIHELTQRGAEVVHVSFNLHGREQDHSRPRHARSVLREIHKLLVEQRCRDEVTLVASGGIALAEHMAKAIICGADLVAIDLPLILALECRLCRGCERGEPCPVQLETVDTEYAVQRITNLMGAWHLQLLEVMGAMGMREVRRLRGETGRAMFREDLEREIFAPLFARK
jgi:ferredoxin